VSELHCLTLRNDRAELARLTAWTDTLVEPLCLSSRTTYAVQLCLEEVVTNVVTYAFAPGTVHDVHVAAWRDDADVHVEVTDDGAPFDPLSHELPAPPKDLAFAQVGGLGIKLIRRFAGRVAYRRSGSMNRLLLSFPVN
jgi:anti-sigma regulatory factor (Ser/Thr protein kinase)